MWESIREDLLAKLKDNISYFRKLKNKEKDIRLQNYYRGRIEESSYMIQFVKESK